MKNYIEALKLFVSGDKLRPEFCTIFSFNAMAMATDCYALAYLPAQKLAEVPKAFTGKTNFLKVIHEYDSSKLKVVRYSEISAIIDRLPKEEETYCTNDDKCDECNGNGEVEWEYTSNYTYNTYTLEEECPVCKGRGIKGVVRKTGKLVCNKYEGLVIENKVFYAWQIERLLKCMNLMGESMLELLYPADDKYAALFGIGELKILLMPALSTAEELKKYRKLEFTSTTKTINHKP